MRLRASRLLWCRPRLLTGLSVAFLCVTFVTTSSGGWQGEECPLEPLKSFSGVQRTGSIFTETGTATGENLKGPSSREGQTPPYLQNSLRPRPRVWPGHWPQLRLPTSCSVQGFACEETEACREAEMVKDRSGIPAARIPISNEEAALPLILPPAPPAELQLLSTHPSPLQRASQPQLIKSGENGIP